MGYEFVTADVDYAALELALFKAHAKTALLASIAKISNFGMMYAGIDYARGPIRRKPLCEWF